METRQGDFADHTFVSCCLTFQAHNDKLSAILTDGGLIYTGDDEGTVRV